MRVKFTFWFDWRKVREEDRESLISEYLKNLDKAQP